MGRSDIIAMLNDEMRYNPMHRGRLMVTAGVNALGSLFVAEAMQAVATHDTFDHENDPEGQHDFGSVKVGTHTLLWKIDAYDKSLEFGSDDPTDPSQTTRVLTIMLEQEF